MVNGQVLGGICLIAAWAVFGGYRACDKRPDMRYYPRVQAAAFPDANSAKLVTLDGDLLTTDNGGRSWRRVPGNEFGFFDHISFLDSLHGWANTRNAHVVRTSDGGASWVVI